MATEINTARLDKLIGMLGSSFDGERASASAMIGKMAAEHKLTITELLHTAFGAQQQVQPQPSWREETLSILEKLRFIAINHADLISAWEHNFATNVGAKCSSDDALSEKQRAVCDRIIFKFEAAKGKASYR